MHSSACRWRFAILVSAFLVIVLVCAAAPPVVSPAAATSVGASKAPLGSPSTSKKKTPKRPHKKPAVAGVATISVPKAAAVGKKAAVQARFPQQKQRASFVVERRAGTSWKRIAATAVKPRARRASLAMPVIGGDQSVRGRLLLGRSARATSRTARLIGVYPCGKSAAPRSTVTYTANDPVKKRGGALVSSLTNGVCGASKKSTITVGVFIVRSADREVLSLFRALEYQARMRGVKVRFLLDSAYGGADSGTISRLKQWSTVTTCSRGCSSFQKATGGLNHTKFLSVSSTEWSRQHLPYVWYSSANFSNRQLQQYWQNAVTVYGDRPFYSATVAAYSKLAQCMRGAGACSTTDLRRSATANVYGFSALRLAASSGVSITADMFPKTDTSDPVVDVLKSASCAGSRGGKVYIAAYLWSGGRARRIGQEIRRLRESGCDVRVIHSEAGYYKSSPEAIQAIRATGAQVRSRSLMHLKTLQMSGVTFLNRRNHYVFFGGNQNFTYSGLRNNNENMVLVSAPMSTRQAGMPQFRSDAMRHWDRMWGIDTHNRMATMAESEGD